VYLGPHTANSALKTFSQKVYGLPPDQITVVQAQKLLESLRPMLKTLVGAAQAERILTQLNLELGLHA
jgi:hypothetical protein